MAEDNFVNYVQVLELFELLVRHKIDYVLLRNLNDELPYKLKKTKDIDILVNPKYKTILKNILDQSGWLKLIHPWDFGNNFKFLYSMDKFLMFKKGDIHLDICFQMSCRSLNDGEWFPLDEAIQRSSFENKRKVTLPWTYELSHEDELIHLLTRSIFDKKKFELPYLKRIDDLLKRIDFNIFSKKCGKVFFKFTPNLIKMMKENLFSDIRSKYIMFKNY